MFLSRHACRRFRDLGLLLLLFVLSTQPVAADEEPVAPVKPPPVPETETPESRPSAETEEAADAERKAWSDQAHLEKQLALACDAVEAACGAKFKQRPTIRVTTKEEMVEILDREMGATFKRLMQLEAGAGRKVLEVLAGGLMAKYEPDTHIVHIMPDTMRETTQLVGRPALMNKRILRVLLAHECTHALDFERWPALDTARKERPTEEGIKAVGAILEGHAQFIAERVAASWQLEKEFEAFSELILAGPEGMSATNKMLADIMIAEIKFTYFKGHEFFRAVHAAKGRAGVEAALAAPPETVAPIERPAIYLDPSLAAAKVDPESILAAADPVLKATGWPIRTVTLQRSQLEAIFGPLGKKRVAAVLEYFEGGQIRVAAKDAGTMVALNVDWWPDEAAAKARLVATRDLLIKKDEMIRAEDGFIKIKSSETTDGAGSENALEGFVHHKTMVAGITEVPLEIQVTRVGRFVLELSVIGTDVSRADQDAVLARAKAAIAALTPEKSTSKGD